MTPLSAKLLDLLDRVAVLLAANDPAAQRAIAEIEDVWRQERPDDGGGLSALLASLRTAAEPAAVAAVQDGVQRALDDGHRQVKARRQAPPRDRFESTSPRADPAEPDTGPDRGWLYPVYFGTNRQPTDAANPLAGFGTTRSAVTTYGRCDVWVPATHRFGSMGRTWWRRWMHLEFADDRLKLKQVQLLTGESFWPAVKSQVHSADAGQRHGLVFLHGYNTSFSAAALRTAQLGFDLKVGGATAFFSWPSQGTVVGYAADAAAIEASETAITRFLVDFSRQGGADVVHLVAHSMGNRGLLRSLQRMAAEAELAAGLRFGQVFLAAPDVDTDLFLGLAALYPQFSGRTTLYASKGDRPVAASAWLHQSPRAGYYPPVTVARGVDRLDTVLVPDFDLDLLGHSYFAQAEAVLHDMFDQMVNGRPPVQRQRIYQSGDHWEIRP